MKRYGQYCPVARAAEILAERWTPLIIRELLWGEDRFNAIARGLPRMSPSLLAARLRELQRAGLVRRDVVDGEPRYRLTEAGTSSIRSWRGSARGPCAGCTRSGLTSSTPRC